MKMYHRDRVLWGLAVGGEVVKDILKGGCRAYQTDRLFLWTLPSYAKRKYRELVKRLHQKGLVQRVLISGEVHYRITGAGRRLLIRYYPVLNKYQESWDGFWRLVTFDVPEKKRQIRDLLRKYLLRSGFGRLQNSVYVSPYDFDEDFLKVVQDKGLSGRVLLLEAKQKHLGNPKNLANKVWGLDNINQEYAKIIDRLGTRFGIKEVRKREEFLKRVHQKYLELLVNDPLLPKELLPSGWLGDKARQYVLRAGVIKS